MAAGRVRAGGFMSVQGTPEAALQAVAPGQLQTAHARLLHDGSFQFSLSAPPQQHLPAWIEMLGKLIVASMPVLKILFWVLLAAGLIAIVAFLAREFLLLRKPPPRTKAGSKLEPELWRPTQARAKALLADADRLAAEGRFSEAAHVLLHRSIADIQGRDPRLIAPSLTSRDIAGLEVLPAPARSAFGLIAQQVEKSLFGGRELDAGGFSACRRAYEEFAFPGIWGRAAP